MILSVINFSDDNDGLPDSSGEYTSASLSKADWPNNFTICAAYMVKAWTTDSIGADLFQLTEYFSDGHGREFGTYVLAFVKLWARATHTVLQVDLPNVYFEVIIDTILFPLTWTRVCFSLDIKLGIIVLAADGKILKNTREYHREIYNNGELTDLAIVLGYGKDEYEVVHEHTGIISQVNVFSSSLSTDRMVALTEAGGDECGAPGDYISWEKEDWQLSGKARIELVGELEKPCRRESEMTIYPSFELQQDCMQHCLKFGHSRSPPVQTEEEWDWLWYEVQAVSPLKWPIETGYPTAVFPFLWLALTDEEVEHEWRDAYKKVEGKWRVEAGGEKLNNTGEAWFRFPWKLPGCANPFGCKEFDNTKGREANCMEMWTVLGISRSWTEWSCQSKAKACPCQYTHRPILQLRGLCRDSTMDSVYTPKQMSISPKDLIILGQLTTQIKYNDYSSQWILTDAVSNVTAVSYATKVSYVLGKHKWNISNDAFVCNNGQPYVTNLKLSGCNPEGEFTCNDGQCVTMEQRCDQLPNCRDKSDEKNCQLLVTEEGYNRKVPPIKENLTDQSILPVEVDTSIDLLKIVDMEEQDHKIDIQFQITLEWRENDRVVYHNLKESKSMNALSDEEISEVWLPRVFYDNTDMKEVTREGMGWEWPTVVTVQREGSHDSCEANPRCRRSGLEMVDEIEIFEGGGNLIAMQQVYTIQFQCKYDLQYYPFDTQVNSSKRRQIP